MNIFGIIGLSALGITWIAMLILDVIRFRSWRIEDKQRVTILELRQEIGRLEMLIQLKS